MPVTHPPFLVGERLYLRRLEQTDLSDEYLAWLNDAEVTRYLGTGRFYQGRDELLAFWQRFQNIQSDLIFAIICSADHRHIGTVTLNHINWIHRTADSGLMIGRKDCWGKGFGFEAWSLLFTYAFERLGLRKIVAGVVDGNAASLATLQKLGFQIEGRLRREVLLDGRYVDTLRLGLFRDEFHNFRHESTDAGEPL